MVGQKENELSLILVSQLLSHIGDEYSFVFIKDLQHNYVWCNDNYARLLGLDKDKSIAGLNDSIINPLHAEAYRADDDKVLRGEILEINNPGYFKDLGIATVTGKIMPIRNERNQIYGIVGTTKLIYSLANKSFAQAISLLNANNISHIVAKSNYTVNTRYGEVKLSKRETECILFLFKCLTADEIAQSLQLSKRSIESYFVNIKNKLNVNHKSEIVEAVIRGGLLEQL